MEDREWQYKDIHTVLKESAERYPDKVYMESPDQGKSITFAQMAAMCNRIANFLKDKGFSARANVIIDEEGMIKHVKVYEIPELPDIDEMITFLGEM